MLCFQMCFEFDSVFLTFIKYSDEHVIKVLSLFFNIAFSVFQTFFKFKSGWTKDEGLPASGPFPCKPCCAPAMSSPLNPVPSQPMCMHWGTSIPSVLGFLFQLPQKWGIGRFSKFICLFFFFFFFSSSLSVPAAVLQVVNLFYFQSIPGKSPGVKEEKHRGWCGAEQSLEMLSLSNCCTPGSPESCCNLSQKMLCQKEK